MKNLCKGQKEEYPCDFVGFTIKSACSNDTTEIDKILGPIVRSKSCVMYNDVETNPDEYRCSRR